MMRILLSSFFQWFWGYRAILIAVLIVPSMTSHAWSCDADSVLDVFEDNIVSHVTIRMKYDKTANSLLFGEREPESGTIWLGPPKRYRIETDEQVIVRGEDTLWSYSKSTKQVTIRAGSLDSLEFGPTGFFGSLRRDFLIVDCATVKESNQNTWRIRLVAKTETAAIQRLTLWVDRSSLWPIKAEYVDYNEETTGLTFSSFQTDKREDKKRFKLRIPDDTEVVVLPTHRSKSSLPEEN